MGLDDLVVKQFRRVSPSRYTAMKECLLCAIWAASGNVPLLPPSPVAELGSVIHNLLEAAGRDLLDRGRNGKVEATWNELVSEAEKKMALSTLRRHQVPLKISVPDFEVRKLRACHRATDIAEYAFRGHGSSFNKHVDSSGFELWVESDDGHVGGYIDRVTMTKDGAVLSEYKSGAVLDSGAGEGPGELKQAYKEQLELYAVLYQHKFGSWPTRLEVVPLQGDSIEVAFDPEDSKCLLAEASKLLRSAKKQIYEVENGSAVITSLASPKVEHCRFCLYRPACKAYWIEKGKYSEENWPTDVQGFLKEVTRLRNGKVCLRITEDNSSTSSQITVRNLTDCTHRHPRLHRTPVGSRVAICGLQFHYRSGDYMETQNTIIYKMD